MKKLIYAGAFAFLMALAACSASADNASEAINSAVQEMQGKGDVAVMVEQLTKEDIDCSKLSPEEYGKLGCCLLYLNNSQLTDEQRKEVDKLFKAYDRAGEGMTTQELQEAQSAALQQL